jgi:hypothetical protein
MVETDGKFLLRRLLSLAQKMAKIRSLFLLCLIVRYQVKTQKARILQVVSPAPSEESSLARVLYYFAGTTALIEEPDAPRL